MSLSEIVLTMCYDIIRTHIMCPHDGHNTKLLRITTVVSFLLIDVSKYIFPFFLTYDVCDFHLNSFITVFLNSPYVHAFIVHCHLCLLLGFTLSLFFLSNLSAFYLSINATSMQLCSSVSFVYLVFL